MKTLTVKISKWFYLPLLFPTPLLFGFRLLLISLFSFEKPEKEFRYYFFPFFGLGICVITIRGVIQYFNSAARIIEIDEEKNTIWQRNFLLGRTQLYGFNRKTAFKVYY